MTELHRGRSIIDDMRPSKRIHKDTFIFALPSIARRTLKYIFMQRRINQARWVRLPMTFHRLLELQKQQKAFNRFSKYPSGNAASKVTFDRIARSG